MIVPSVASVGVIRLNAAVISLRARCSFDRSVGSCNAADMALIDSQKDARRLARAIASDLSLYNEEKIVEGIQQDTLFDVIKDEIEEGRTHYTSRVSPAMLAKNFYDRAVVDILVKSKGHVKSKMW